MNKQAEENTTVQLLRGELAKAADQLQDKEVRFLVDSYYRWQEHRIQLQNQVRAVQQGMDEGVRPVVAEWFLAQADMLESQMSLAIKRYVRKKAKESSSMEWLTRIGGIGHILAAGLATNITEVSKDPVTFTDSKGKERTRPANNTVGHDWSHAGLNPEQKWEKGKKRPYNASLKMLCWKVGESFIKCKSRKPPIDYYGKLYDQRKALEIERNESGHNKEEGARQAKRCSKGTESYKHGLKGRLSDGHIHNRSRRWTVKIFLEHYFAERWKEKYPDDPRPAPFVIAHGGHVDYIPPPF